MKANNIDLTWVMGLLVNPIRKNTTRRSEPERSARYQRVRPQNSEVAVAAARKTPSGARLVRLCIAPPCHQEQREVLQDVGHDRKPDALPAEQVERAVDATGDGFGSHRDSAKHEVIEAVRQGADDDGERRGETQRQQRPQPDHAEENLFSYR